MPKIRKNKKNGPGEISLALKNASLMSISKGRI